MDWLDPLAIGLTQGLLMAWAVLAFSIAYRLLGFPDLTVEGSLPIGAAIYAVFTRSGGPLPISLLAAMIGGGLAGCLTALLHVRFKVNKFLSGIIVVSISYSITLRVMGGPNVGLLNQASIFDWLRLTLGSGGVLLGLCAVCVLFTGLLALLLSSRSGVALRAAGSSPNFAQSVGVNPGLSIVLGLAGCNALAALSGVLIADHQGFADVSSGQGVLVLALAALTIGEALVPQRWLAYHVYILCAGSLGSVLYYLVATYAVRAGLNPTDLRLATGVMVLLVVVVRMSSGVSSGEGAPNAV